MNPLNTFFLGWTAAGLVSRYSPPTLATGYYWGVFALWIVIALVDRSRT